MYRRHRQYCKGGHAHNTRTSEYDERKKGWRRCECPIFVSGTLQDQFKRQNSGQWEWDAARALAGQFEAVGSWDARAADHTSVTNVVPALSSRRRRRHHSGDCPDHPSPRSDQTSPPDFAKRHSVRQGSTGQNSCRIQE